MLDGAWHGVSLDVARGEYVKEKRAGGEPALGLVS
jgi:hypothetical protein